MDIVSSLRKEESKLSQQLETIRTAIKMLGGKASPTKRTKRKLSAASRAKIAAAQRKRWAKVRKAQP